MMTTLQHQQLRLLALRRSCGLSQQALAPHLGVTQAAISHWERTGRIRSQNLANLERLANLTEKRRGKVLPSLRVAAAELAEQVIPWKGYTQSLHESAERVLQILKLEPHNATHERSEDS